MIPTTPCPKCGGSWMAHGMTPEIGPEGPRVVVISPKYLCKFSMPVPVQVEFGVMRKKGDATWQTN